MRNQLINGLHLAIVTNRHGGYGGSIFAIETFTVCKQLGIPAILTTFDHQRSYPDIGPDLRQLNIPGVTSNRGQVNAFEDLTQVFAEAQAIHKFVIIDFPTGYSTNHPMFEVLKNSVALAATTAALVPILSGDNDISGATTAIQQFTNIGICFDRGLIRRWTFHGDPSPTDMSRLPNYPLWRAGGLSMRARNFINQEVQRVGNPAFNALPRLCEIQATGIKPCSDAAPLQESVDHLESAKKAIFKAILAPITVRIP